MREHVSRRCDLADSAVKRRRLKIVVDGQIRERGAKHSKRTDDWRLNLDAVLVFYFDHENVQ